MSRFKSLTTEEFIERAVSVHKDTYIYDKVCYTKSHDKVIITCRKHGDFSIRANGHLNGKGCYHCGRIKNIKGQNRFYRNQRPDLSNIKVPDGSKVIPLGTNGDYSIVDAEDYNKVIQHNWYLSATGYAINDSGAGRMHRFIMNPPDDMEIDHINRNKIDNRKINLRVCTGHENSCNTSARKECSSKYKGVSWIKERKKWRAQIVCKGKNINLGRYSNEIDAAKAYDKAANKYHKEFAFNNFKNNK